jgi:hypothetical protein
LLTNILDNLDNLGCNGFFIKNPLQNWGVKNNKNRRRIIFIYI